MTVHVRSYVQSRKGKRVRVRAHERGGRIKGRPVRTRRARTGQRVSVKPYFARKQIATARTRRKVAKMSPEQKKARRQRARKAARAWDKKYAAAQAAGRGFEFMQLGPRRYAQKYGR